MMGKITRGRPEKTWQRSAEKCKDDHDNSCIIARCNMSCAVFNISMKGSTILKQTEESYG